MSLYILQTGRGKKVGRSKAFSTLAGKKKVYQSLLKREKVIFFYFDRVCVDPRLSTESPTQPQYNYFSLLGILFLSRSDIMI